jgi:hypothetical protein
MPKFHRYHVYGKNTTPCFIQSTSEAAAIRFARRIGYVKAKADPIAVKVEQWEMAQSFSAFATQS